MRLYSGYRKITMTEKKDSGPVRKIIEMRVEIVPETEKGRAIIAGLDDETLWQALAAPLINPDRKGELSDLIPIEDEWIREEKEAKKSPAPGGHRRLIMDGAPKESVNGTEVNDVSCIGDTFDHITSPPKKKKRKSKKAVWDMNQMEKEEMEDADES